MGKSRFSALLEPLGLCCEFPDELKKCIFEFAQIRNVLAHGSINADRNIVENCPWLNLNVGDELNLSNNVFTIYNNAAMCFITLLIYRVAEIYGRQVDKVREEYKEQFIKDYNNYLNFIN